MYIYTETGILCEKIVYPDLREKCGKPVAVSEDGKTMLFRKCNKSFIINVVEITINGPKFMYKIDIAERTKKYLSRLRKGIKLHPFESHDTFSDDMNKFAKNYLANMENV